MSKIAAITFLLFLLIGGTVYVADHAAHGDLLYPLDPAVENLQAGLSTDSNSASQLQFQFAAERLDEAEVLLQEEGNEKEDSLYCSELLGAKHPAGRRLADQYDLDYEIIMTWFCRGLASGKTGYGFGEIMLALETTGKTGLSPEELL